MRWRAIPNWEALYEVSDGGLVRSIDRRVWSQKDGGRWETHRGRVLKPNRIGGGHLQVRLSRGGRSVDILVHRAVLEAFAGPCPEGLEGLHGNGDPSDNRVENLRWGTRSENTLDSVEHGTHAQARRTHCAKGHEFTPENTSTRGSSGKRGCRICARHRSQKYRQKRRQDMHENGEQS